MTEDYSHKLKTKADHSWWHNLFCRLDSWADNGAWIRKYCPFCKKIYHLEYEVVDVEYGKTK